MRLYELLEGIAKPTFEDMEITGIISDTRRKIIKGELFVCVNGKEFDGHDFGKAMLEKGASAIVCEHDLGLPKQIIVDDTREFYSLACAKWFKNPERELKMIAVTGTNGKTTVSTILKNVLREYGFSVGLIGTCQNEINDIILKTERTTPEPHDYFELLRIMADRGCEYVVMEVSSQGLAQKRIGNSHFKLAVFTNLTQDHLDFHETMENYYLSKRKLFDMCDIAVINTDDEYGKRCFDEIKGEKYSYGLKEKADFMAKSAEFKLNGCRYTYKNSKKEYPVEFKMPGVYNVYNSLSVLACCELLGLDTEKSVQIIKRLNGVKGRCETLYMGDNFTVMCDYAHTPDALENVLKSLKEFKKGRLVCLFGCGGNRDKLKRPLMAMSAEKYSDFLVITSDNPRDEDPDEIIEEIVKGLKGDNFVKITDRRAAIRWAIKNAKPNDLIVLCGKGHEEYMIFENEKRVYFSESEIVKEIILEFKLA